MPAVVQDPLEAWDLEDVYYLWSLLDIGLENEFVCGNFDISWRPFHTILLLYTAHACRVLYSTLLSDQTYWTRIGALQSDAMQSDAMQSDAVSGPPSVTVL